MREWFIVSMFLIITVMFYFLLLNKMESIQTDITIIQAQMSSTICFESEEELADNSTLIKNN
jgi:hypothetical protein